MPSCALPLRGAARLALAVTLACAATGSAGAAGDDAPAFGARHPMRRLAPDHPGATPAAARLEYFGGPVVSNPRVVMILWGDGPFAPFVAGAAPPSLPAFFERVTASGWMGALAEYDTKGQDSPGGIGQHVGGGSFAGLVSIAPAPSPGEGVDDAAIVAELARQLAAGKVPAPERDGNGNPSTIYFLHFPAGKTITVGSARSCVDFCAYHGAFDWDGVPVRYAVMPDLSGPSGCDAACGEGTPLEVATAVASHELAGVITDPDVTRATGLWPPLAWYDPVHGEIGDLCAGAEGVLPAPDGVAYRIQELWSNAEQACVGPRDPAATAAATAPAAGPVPASTAPAAAVPVANASPEGAPPRPALAIAPSAAADTSLGRPPLAPGAPGPAPLAAGGGGPVLPGALGPGFTIEEENDAFGFARSDSFYTQGLRVSSRWASRSRLFPDGHLLLGVALGQAIYTPSDIRIADLQTLRHDRPYAGWLYGALLWDLFLDRAPFTLGAGAAGPWSELDVQLAAGTTGPRSLAGRTQTTFHELSRVLKGSTTSPPDPAGWSIYQTANRATADASLRYQFDAVQAGAWLGPVTSATGSVLALRFSPRARLDAGTTFDGAALGLELRGGLMGLSRPRAARAALPVELYAFARGEGRWVAYNGLIEGPLLGGVTPLVSIARWGSGLDLGLTARIGGVELEYAQLWRTSELDRLPPGASRIHDVGRFRVSLLY